MKVRFPFQTFLLFIYILTFALASGAQEKPQALKFDEFDDFTTNQFYSYNKVVELSFSQRIERFAKQLAKERGVRAYIIYYKAQIGNDDVERNFVNRINGSKSQFEYTDQIKEVVVIDGGYRERNTVEFWIVPENAEPPMPMPTINKSETFVCQNFAVSGTVPFDESNTIDFSVFGIYGSKEPSDYALTWKVFGGEIIEGQETSKIKVRLGETTKRATVFVEIGGLPFPCPKVFSATAETKGKLHLIDSFGPIANGETRARLDYLLSVLQKNPTAKGYIIVYGNRSENGRDTARRLTLYNNHFLFRGADVNRINITKGGFREESSSDLWLSFDDAQKPIPTPTVDEKFIVVPKPARKSRPRKK